MRAAPAFQVSLQRFGAWRGAVSLLAALSLAVMVVWLWSQPRPIAAGVLALSGVGVGAALLAAVSAVQLKPVDLRWDGRAWHLGAATGEPVAGALHVMLDLGGWMLLRFKPDAWSFAATWLPIQRRGLEAPWHALRCAVYAARPAAPDDDAIGGL
jgi:hypothetical protein